MLNRRYINPIFNVFALCLVGLSPIGVSAGAKKVEVSIDWTYESSMVKIDLYQVRPDKAPYVSETGTAEAVQDLPIADKITTGKIQTSVNNPTAFVLVAHNSSKEDAYFFAVPHEMNPHHASAGHYFECLCIGRLFKVPPGKYWYRIVRVRLNDTFKYMPAFKITHQIIGVSKADALGKYKGQLYEK